MHKSNLYMLRISKDIKGNKMKKTLVIAAVTAMVSMPSYADTYFALGIGAGEYDFDYSGPSSESILFEDMNDMGAFGLKIGHYLNETIRGYGYVRLAVSDSSKRGGFDVDTATREIGAGADYLHYVSSQFYLFAGGNLGFQKTVIDDVGDPPAVKEDNSGLSSGINLGLGYGFTENFAQKRAIAIATFSAMILSNMK